MPGAKFPEHLAFHEDAVREIDANGNAFGWYALEMLDEEGTVLDVVQIGNTGRLRTEQKPWEDLEAGKMVEHPIEPRIQVAAINGTALVFAASTCYDDMRVSIEGGGIMSSRSFKREGGTEILMGQLFFNGSNPGGQYNLTLANSKGMILDQAVLNWNGEELSLADAGDRWTADDQVIGMLTRGKDAALALEAQTVAMAGVVDIFATQTGLENKNVDDYPVVREFQESELWEASQFHTTQEELNESYFVMHPEMRNPETEQLRTMRGDTLGALWENIHLFGGVVGRVLDKAVDVYFVSQRGGNQQEALNKVQVEIDIWSGHPKLAELKIETGIELPTFDEFLAEGLKIYEEDVGIFYNTQGFKTREFVKQEYRSSSIYWQIAYGGQGDPGTGGEGVLVASAGGIDEIVDGSGNPVLSGVARRLARIGLRIQEMEQQAANGGYVDPQFEAWLNTRDDPNVQREREKWKEGVGTVLAMQGKDLGGSEEGTVESNPLKPTIAEAQYEVASLAWTAEVIVEGMRVEEELATKEIVRNAIEERVSARLSERLQSMTMEEHANARGLLRLQEDGRMDEYFASLFTGETSEAVSAELSDANGYSVFYLVDREVQIVYQTGHAAMIMGSETEGWYFFSFGVGTVDGTMKYLTENGNMEVDFFPTLREAQEATQKYDQYLRWDVTDVSAIRSAFRQASSHLSKNYNVFTENCDDIASDIIRAAGIELNDRWMPNLTYLEEEDSADEASSWKEIIDLHYTNSQ